MKQYLTLNINVNHEQFVAILAESNTAREVMVDSVFQYANRNYPNELREYVTNFKDEYRVLNKTWGKLPCIKAIRDWAAENKETKLASELQTLPSAKRYAETTLRDLL